MPSLDLGSLQGHALHLAHNAIDFAFYAKFKLIRDPAKLFSEQLSTLESLSLESAREMIRDILS